MRLAIRKWGNSLAVRIPRSIVQEVQFTEGCEVEVAVKDGDVVLSRAAPAVTLRVLLDGITKENLHGEVGTGSSRGREAW